LKNQARRHPHRRTESPWLLHLVGLVGCVGLPAFATAIAPVGVTHLEREGTNVRATITWNVFFVIPYHRATVENVTAIDDRFHAGELSEIPGNTADETRRQVRSEDEAFLVIHGPSGDGEVPVSPVSIRRVLEKARDFLNDENAKQLRLITVANYKFGVLAGGILSLLTVLYVLGVIFSLGRFVWRVVRGG
jgi:hypothetical protein